LRKLQVLFSSPAEGINSMMSSVAPRMNFRCYDQKNIARYRVCLFLSTDLYVKLTGSRRKPG